MKISKKFQNWYESLDDTDQFALIMMAGFLGVGFICGLLKLIFWM